MLSLHDVQFHPFLIITDIGIPPFCFQNQKPRNHRPENITHEKYPHHVRQPDHVGTAEVIEQQRREDGAEFAYRRADAVREAADAGGEDFGGDDEGGWVGAEVEEELRKH